MLVIPEGCLLGIWCFWWSWLEAWWLAGSIVAESVLSCFLCSTWSKYYTSSFQLDLEGYTPAAASFPLPSCFWEQKPVQMFT